MVTNLLSRPWTLRKRGGGDDPRIHFAVNGASLGCPMLREEADVAPHLEHRGIQSVRGLAASHADVLAQSEEDRARIRLNDVGPTP